LNLTGLHGVISQKTELFKHTRCYLVEYTVSGFTPTFYGALEIILFWQLIPKGDMGKAFIHMLETNESP
jgi:hypothetical protein